MATVTMAYAVVPAPDPVRELTVGVTDIGLACVAFAPGRRRLAAAAERVGATLVRDPARTDPVVEALAGYLAGRVREVCVPLDWSLTAGAQRTVLASLHATVGYGETVSYGELAACSGVFDGGEHAGVGARRVGSIMGSNPLPVVVPCHRVVAAGGLGGFGGGLEVKRWLLALEGALPQTLDLGMP